MTPKEVKYETTSDFGLLNDGTVINALLLVRDGNRGLIYHPKTKGECPSFEMCSVWTTRAGEEIWKPLEVEAYVNATWGHKVEERFLGEGFKWTRTVFKEGVDR